MGGSHQKDEIVEGFVRFVQEHLRWSGSYKALINGMAAMDAEVAAWFPEGTKGFTHMLPVLRPLLEARGISVTVTGKINQRLKFLVCKTDSVVPITATSSIADVDKNSYIEFVNANI